MPRKIRQLARDLTNGGFINRGGKGSHRNFSDEFGFRVTLSGQDGKDAKHYQEKEVAEKLAMHAEAKAKQDKSNQPKK